MRGGRTSGSAGTRLLSLGVMVLGAALAVIDPAGRAGAADRNVTSGQSGSSGGVIISEMNDVQRVKVVLNKSRTFRVETAFSTIVSGSPDIIDVKSLSDHLIYIQGKQTGTTNVLLFDASLKQIGILDVEVGIDTSTLQQNIRASTGATGIRVSASEGQVVLSGTVPDAVSAERAMGIATGTVQKGGTVVNAMTVAAPQQVLLEVRFVEASRDAARQLGVNIYGGNTAGNRGINTGLGAGGPGTGVVFAGNSQAGLPVIATAQTLFSNAVPFGNILTPLAQLKGGGSIDVLITALESKGLVKRLAEPNLIALSGDSARFLAGGEFPVPVASTPVPGALPTVTIEFKKFGVELGFVPTVLARGTINLRIEPSVSELDFTQQITISGTTIPSLVVRDARTTVELRDGQSFAIAGLLQTRNQEDISQLPWVGSVPVLGALFRSSAYQKHETDLVIIVTPHLVAPAAPGQQLATPLDKRLPPNDVDFFLNGQMEVKKRYTDYVNSGGEIKGPYGHMIGPNIVTGPPPPPPPPPAASGDNTVSVRD